MKPETCQYRPQAKLIAHIKKNSSFKDGYGSATAVLGLHSSRTFVNVNGLSVRNLKNDTFVYQ